MDPETAYDLITRDLQEVLGGELVKKILTDGERHLKCYWGALCLSFMAHVSFSEISSMLTPNDIQERHLRADVSFLC